MASRVLRFGLALTKLAEAIAGVLVLVVVVLNSAQVFYRYVLFDPLGWTEEAMRYSMIWVAFLGSSALVFRGEHPALEIFARVASRPLRHAFHYVILMAIGVFCAILVWKGFPLAWGNRNQTSPAAQIPMVFPYMAVAVGGLLMLIKIVCLLLLPPDRVPRGDHSGVPTLPPA